VEKQLKIKKIEKNKKKGAQKKIKMEIPGYKKKTKKKLKKRAKKI